MRIELERLNDAYHLRATNEQGNEIYTDSSADHGGSNLGFRPMQLLLAGIGSCSAIDIIDILRKQKQPLRDLKITVDGEREQDKVPALWQTVHIHYRFYGEVAADKAARAIELSLEKYCSVSKTLELAGARITSSFEVIA